jgi:hypothetical protein
MDPDDLFGLPLDRFVPERTALARALRSQGRRDEAAEVARARKPSVAAWAVNQLVRTQGQDIAQLFEAGDAAREAQDEVLSGHGKAGGLRAAAERERAAVDQLVSSARGLLTTEGHGLSSNVIERVAETLHAAALEDEARAAVRDGRLTRELRHIGLGVQAGQRKPQPASTRASTSESASARASKSAPGSARASKSEPSSARASKSELTAARASKQRAETQRIERERAQAIKAARSGQAAARRAADRAARALAAAQSRRDQAEQALRQAEADLSGAQEQAQVAEQEHRRATEELAAIKR